MNISDNILVCEREVSAYIETLTNESPGEAEKFCTMLLEENADKLSLNKAVSAAYARCVCRYLLHKKNKSRLGGIIADNDTIRKAIFGRLNTYQYSLIFILKRVFRRNSAALTREVLELLSNNPFRNDLAKSYAREWSLGFLIDETMKAPADYLDLSEESLKIINQFMKEGKLNEKEDS